MCLTGLYSSFGSSIDSLTPSLLARTCKTLSVTVRPVTKGIEGILLSEERDDERCSRIADSLAVIGGFGSWSGFFSLCFISFSLLASCFSSTSSLGRLFLEFDRRVQRTK